MDTESASSSIPQRPFWIQSLIAFTGMVLLAGFFILLLLIFRFRTTMPEFGINSASINSLKIKSSRITAQWNITLFVTNHDGYHSISYDDISFNINYNNQQYQSLVSTIPLKPFSQSSGFTNSIIVQQNMDVKNDVATDIGSSSSSNGIVNFEVGLSATIMFKDVFNFQKVRTMKIVCEPLSFKLEEDHLQKSSNWILLYGVACH
ncbi:uncharacterized protein LOC127104937 [Lathyrus oleraceus]|uniref:uncharacterized protein LOC127104937 n=1 Tax=Pisum sativum TaxID=3888 RepID=UPI0021CFBE60|nr:uncharacterized protein LOC127104937 [Pisum sativum]